MANKMNFGVGINLYADKFRKGAKQVNGYLKGMKTQVIALGAAFGIGGFALGNFFSKAFETVRSLNKAQTTLKNVTKTTTEYNKAMNFLNENAKKYNKDIIDLTNNYSKFVAASQGTGMALKDVQSTFEALTQASTYYNLSQDETNGVMLALSQMMSKGKIQAEELRGQLGERLPGALGVMARALGVTQKELDKLMQDGKLISSEVLPKFGEQLKLETAGFDKNSIEGSLQELKRMWTDIWKDPKMQEAFKGLIHSLTNALQWTANNIKNIFQFAIAGMVAYANAMFGKMLAKFEAHRKILVARYDVIDSNVLGKHIQSPSTFGMPTADVKRLNEIRGVLNRIADTELLNVEQKYAMISKYSERWKFQSEAAVNVSKRWADQIQHTYNRYEILKC